MALTRVTYGEGTTESLEMQTTDTFTIVMKVLNTPRPNLKEVCQRAKEKKLFLPTEGFLIRVKLLSTVWGTEHHCGSGVGRGFSRGPPNACPPTGPSLLPTPLCGGLGGQVCGNPAHSSHWTRRESPTDCAFKSLGEMTPFSRLKSASKDFSVSPNGVEIWQPSPHRIQRTEQLAGGLGCLVPRGKWMLSHRTVLCLKNSMDSPRFESSHTWPPSDQSGLSRLQFFSCL